MDDIRFDLIRLMSRETDLEVQYDKGLVIISQWGNPLFSFCQNIYYIFLYNINDLGITISKNKGVRKWMKNGYREKMKTGQNISKE